MAAAADQRRTPDLQVEPRATNRRFSAAYKQKILAEYDGLSTSGRARCCAGRGCTPR